MSFNEFMNEIKFLYSGTFYHEFLQKLGIVENFEAVKEHLISATVEFKNPNARALNLREQYTEYELVDFLAEMRKYAYSNNAITNGKFSLANGTELIYTIDRGWDKIESDGFLMDYKTFEEVSKNINCARISYFHDKDVNKKNDRARNALRMLFNFVDKHPEKTIFDDEEEHSDNNRIYCGKRREIK